MNARDELAETIAANLDRIFGTRDFGPATQDYKLADALIAAGYVKHRTINTTDEVDALPTGSVVLATFGTGVNIYRNELIAPDAHNHVVEHGPATVLYEPEPAA